MIQPTIPRRSTALSLLSAILLACSEPTGQTSVSLLPGAKEDATPVKCPTSSTVSVAADVGPLGGIVTAVPTATSISLPAGAVLGQTSIRVTVPASQYMLIDIQANQLDHFLFELPVTVVLDYSRCSRSDIDRAALSVYVFDPITGVLGERMTAVDDKLTGQLSFLTGHLTSYVVAE